MSTLNQKLTERDKLINELGMIDEFRRGSLNVYFRKCGKLKCVCNEEGHPGHGPVKTLTQTVNGKTKTRNLPSSKAVALISRQIEERRKFLDWQSRLIKINEEICDLRLEQALSEDETEKESRKKKRRPKSSKRSSAKSKR
jgi:hypothetical protein